MRFHGGTSIGSAAAPNRLSMMDLRVGKLGRAPASAGRCGPSSCFFSSSGAWFACAQPCTATVIAGLRRQCDRRERASRRAGITASVSRHRMTPVSSDQAVERVRSARRHRRRAARDRRRARPVASGASSSGAAASGVRHRRGLATVLQDLGKPRRGDSEGPFFEDETSRGLRHGAPAAANRRAASPSLRQRRRHRRAASACRSCRRARPPARRRSPARRPAGPAACASR